MTATTTLSAASPVHGHRSLWTRSLFTLAGVAMGIVGTVVVTDDGDSSPAIASSEPASSVASSAGSMSADATERWTPTADDAGVTSADAAERRVSGEEAAQAGPCTSGSTSADAAERCSQHG